MQEIEKLALTTGLWDIRKQIMYLEDDASDKLIDDFYKVRMLTVLEAVNVEVTSVIGQSWSILCQQSNGKWAAHSLLVLWLAIHSEIY